jgi:hypothetical protein
MGFYNGSNMQLWVGRSVWEAESLCALLLVRDEVLLYILMICNLLMVYLMMLVAQTM